MAKALSTTLEAYLKSPDFKTGVIASTKASWGGSGYSVELFKDGTWRNLWNGEIGNKYETPGVIIGLPTISGDVREDDLSDGFDNEEYELAKEMRENFSL